MQLKKEPYILALAAVCVGALTFLAATGKITWPEMSAGIVLLGLPSVFKLGTTTETETKP